MQNKLLRLITNTKLTDRVSTDTLLKQTNLMSVNQINGQIKIQEIWESRNLGIKKYSKLSNSSGSSINK